MRLGKVYLGDNPNIKMYQGSSLVYNGGAAPLDYTVVPYIISKGKSWADTGLFLDPAVHRVQGSFIVSDLSMVSTGGIYLLEGARSSSVAGSVKVNTMLKKLSLTTYQLRRDWGIEGATGAYDSFIYEVGKEYFFDYTPEYTEINGVRVAAPAYGGVCANSYYIGKMNDPALPSGYVPPGIHATSRTFSVWATGEVLAEIKPAQNNIDKSYQLVDIVSQRYLPNLGTEPFALPPYPAWVYEMGTPIYGVKSTGASYFAPDFVLGVTGKTELDVIASSDAGTQGLYGWYDADGSRNASGIYLNKWFTGLDATRSGSLVTVGKITKLIIDRDNSFFNVDGIRYYVPPALNPDNAHKPLLCHRSGVVTPTFGSGFNGILTGWREFAADGTPLVNSIPLIHKDGTVGRLDLVTRVFEGSATSTPFTAVTEEGIAQQLINIGVEPSSDVEENIRMLNERGIQI